MHSYLYVYQDHVARRTPVSEVLNTVRQDYPDGWSYSTSGAYVAPAFCVGRRRFNSHVPIYRHVNTCSQFLDFQLPFSPLRATKASVHPRHYSETVTMPKSDWYVNRSPTPSDTWCDTDTLYSVYVDAQCSRCFAMENCFVSKNSSHEVLCNSCLKADNTHAEYPFSFPETEAGAITGTCLTYTGYVDVFKCEKCSMLIGAWKEGDDPIAVHNSEWGSTCKDCVDEEVYCCVDRCHVVSNLLSDPCPDCLSEKFCVCKCKKFIDRKNLAYAVPKPLKFLQGLVGSKIIPNFTVKNSRHHGVVTSLITCNGVTVGGTGLTRRSARNNAARRFLYIANVFPDTHMLSTLRSLPSRSSETVELTNATLAHVNQVIDRQDEGLTRLRENLEVKSSDVSRQVSELLPKVSHAVDNVSETLDSFKCVLAKINNWLPSLSVDVIDMIKDVFVSLFFALTTRSVTPLVQGFTSFALRSNVFSHLVSALSSWLNSLKYDTPFNEDIPNTEASYPSVDNVRETLASIYDSFGTGLCIALSGVLSFIAIVCYGVTDLSTASFNKLLTQSSLIGRALVGVRSFKDVFFGIWEYADNIVCKLLYNQDRKSLDLAKNYPNLSSVLAVFKYFHDDVNSSNLLGCNSSACELLVKADNLYHGYVDKAHTLGHREIVARLKESRRSVKSLIDKAQLYLSCGDGYRIPPLIIFLHGSAGCGKTELSSIIQKELANKYYPDVPHKDVIYSRKAENEFWDGVKQSSKIIVYDDALQVVDTAAKPNPEIFEFIRLNNSDSFQVHMSSVDDKSGTYVSPDFVVATSNVDPHHYRPRSIHSQDAFCRRMDLRVRVDVANEYARVVTRPNQCRVPDERKIWKKQNPGKSDTDLTTALQNGSYSLKTDPEIYSLHVRYTMAGKEETKTCTYTEFMALLEQLRACRVAAHKDKRPNEIPVLPDTLNSLAASVQSGSDRFIFHTDWLGFYSDATEACNYLSQELDAVFLPGTDDLFMSKNVVDQVLYDKLQTEDFVAHDFFQQWLEARPDEQFSDCLEYFEASNSPSCSVWNNCKDYASNVVHTLSSVMSRVRSFIVSHWASISMVVGAAFAIGGGAAYLCSRKCRVQRVLTEGGTIMQLVGTLLCIAGCEFCSRLKKGNLVMSVRSVSDGRIMLVPSDVRRVAHHYITTATACKIPIHFSITQSLCDESFVKFDDTRDTFCVLESHQDAKVKQVNVESHQDAKVKQVIVESHQDTKVKQVNVESHQDVKPKCVCVESHQDVVPKNLVVESHQDYKPKAMTVESNVCESCRETKLSMPHVEGNVASDYAVQWTNPVIESSCDNNAQDVVNKLLAKNFVRLYKPREKLFTHGLFIKGRTLLMPKHLFDELDGSVDVVAMTDSSCTRVPVSILSHVNIKRGDIDVDVVMCEMGANTIARKDIVSYFPTRSELSSLSGLMAHGELRVFSSALYGKNSMLMPRDSQVEYVQCVDHIESHNPEKKSYYVRKGFEARGNSSKGDCCSPYILFNPSSRAKIVGLHCAGFDNTSRVFAQTVTQEDFNLIATSHCGMVCTEYPLTTLTIPPLPNTLPIGCVKAAPNPTKSSIVPSPIYGCFEVRTAPAALHSDDEDLLVKNALKVTKNVVLLDEDLLDMCVHNVKQVLNAPGVSDVEKRVLTHEESITGLTGHDYMNALNRSTSAGFPYCLRKQKGKPGKQTWLGSEEFIVDHPDLKEHVDKIVSKAKSGIVDVELGIFSATMKDERRPLEKVRQKKTRVFAASNQGLALAQRRYFLAFMEHVMKNRIDNEIGLGVNVYSYDWTRIVDKLRKVGSKVIAGDFSNFDGSLNSQILSRVAEIVTDWYDDEQENGLTRHTLVEYLFNASWLINGQVFQLNHSQPSGNPLTTLINCMYNMIIFRYVYLLARRSQGLSLTLSNFCLHVSSVFYGDDSLCCVSDKVCEWFNQHTITHFMSVTGHDYTDETKSGTPPPYRSLSEVTFLKREFVFRESFWVAPLSKVTIEDMCMWSRKNIDPQEALRQTTRIASFEASLHGDEYLKTFAGVVRRACRAAGYRESILHPAECRNFLLSQQGRSGALDSDFLSELLDM
nr:hypothetical protein 1 [Wenzhou shrimp virus 7]